MSNSKEININLFKPHTGHAKANAKMIIIMILIWAIAVFGFQFLLLGLQKPVPEENYVKFETLWPNISSGKSKTAQSRDFSKILLSVLGKNIALSAKDKTILQETLSNTVYGLMSAKDRSIFKDIDKNREKAAKLTVKALGLKSEGFDKLMIELLPVSLVSVKSAKISSANKQALPDLMSFYLIHNRSILTDAKFLGFPFHYFYTSQLLLIIFVVLCLIYCILTDRIHEKYGFVEKND